MKPKNKLLSLVIMFAMPLILAMSFHNEPQLFTAVKSGAWTDPATWLQKQVPNETNDVLITNNVTVTIKSDVTVRKMTVLANCSVVMDRAKTLSLQLSGNLILYGKLQARPASASIVHTIRFINIDESKMIGTTPAEMMEIPDSDVGLWIRYGGVLDAAGTSKTAWTRLKSSATAGDNFVLLSAAPSGWQPGDEISVTPTLPISDNNFYKAFDIVKVKCVSRDTVFFDSTLKYNHPNVLNQWTKKYYTAEVLNLTRNVRIEGTPTGRSHINMHMLTGKFTQSYISIRYMGPRQKDGLYTKHVLGRYADHIHMNGDATRGSTITGVVVRDCGSWGFVPHASHGITFTNDITFDTYDAGYTWDFPPQNGSDSINNSNNTTYNNCVCAIVRFDPVFRGYRTPGFQMNAGKDNSCTNSIVVGMATINSNGFDWSEKDNYMNFNVWLWKNNIAHNNAGNAAMSWQNDTGNHVIEGLVAYRNGGDGFEDGAYRNSYKVKNSYLIDNAGGILSHAQAMPKGARDTFGYHKSYSGIKCNGALKLTRHLLAGSEPILFYNCSFSMVFVQEDTASKPNVPGTYDFVNCNIKPTDFNLVTIAAGSVFRVQNSTGSPYMINDKKQVITISKFFPKQ